MTWRKEVMIFTTNGVRTIDKDRSRFLEVLVSSGKNKKKPLDSQKEGSSSAPRRAAFSSSSRGSFSGGKSSSDGNVPLKKQTRQYAGTTGVLDRSRKSPFPFNAEIPPTQPTRPASKQPRVAGKENKWPSRPSENQRPRQTVAKNGTTRTEGPQRASQGAPPLRVTATLPTARSRPPEAPTRPRVAATLPTAQSRPPEAPTLPRVTATLPPKVTSTRSTKKPVSDTPQKPTDSTWFYPVGSEVMHKNLGKGIVLPPPRQEECSQALPVRVKFEDGDKKDFSALGTDLSPIVL
jgi:hypothetical protein